MNNFLYTLVLVVFFSFSGFQQAQNLSDNYKPLTCKGALSTDLSTDYMVLANKEIDISTLSQGIYLLKVTTQNNTTLIKKLVVE